METTQIHKPRRRLDMASLILLLIGIASGTYGLWLVVTAGYSVLIVIPAVVAVVVGARHVTKQEAPRQ